MTEESHYRMSDKLGINFFDLRQVVHIVVCPNQKDVSVTPFIYEYDLTLYLSSGHQLKVTDLSEEEKDSLIKKWKYI